MLGGIRTPDPRLRRPLLYPAELQTHSFLLVYTIEVFQKHVDIDGIILVCVSNWIDRAKELIVQYDLDKIKEVVAGGSTGHKSRLYGLQCVKKYYSNAIVLIHDGVRH